MQKNSALFTHLSELVEDRIAGIDDMFKLDNDTISKFVCYIQLFSFVTDCLSNTDGVKLDTNIV
jgi:hypothetical protein